MPLLREQHLKSIIEKLSYLQLIVSMSNKQQLYDIDHGLEDFCVGLLNRIYGWNLVNLNNAMKNTPAIDLGDKDSKISVQITSDKRGDKVKKTVADFETKKLCAEYSRLIILILVPKQERYKLTLEQTFGFSQEKDIWDYGDLINDIKTLPTEKIQEINNYIEAEFQPFRADMKFDRYDRLKNIANQIQNGQEHDVRLEVETLCSQEIIDAYERLTQLISVQSERIDFLDFYEMNLYSILSEEPEKKQELDMLMAQSEQYDYFEPLYSFCDNYIVRVQLPYAVGKDEFISYRNEHKEIIERSRQIEMERKQCVELIKRAMKKLV